MIDMLSPLILLTLPMNDYLSKLMIKLLFLTNLSRWQFTGSRQSRRESVSGGMGGLLSANLSGFSSRGSSGSDINNGKNKTGSGGGKFVANTTTSSQAACPTILVWLFYFCCCSS